MTQIRRRDLLKFALATGSIVGPVSMLRAKSAPLRVNAVRLRSRLEALSLFGRPPGGSFADGVSRVAYSDADLAARDYAMRSMREAGLAVRIDTAGNIIGRRAGRDSRAKPIITGSHIDTVPGGGNFDGNLGAMAAIEIAHVMSEQNVRLKHPLEVVIWSNEEGAPMGSGIAAAQFNPEGLDATVGGMTAREGIKRIGGDPDRLSEALRPSGSIHSYLELHVEQGGILDKAGIPIGIVEGIVAIHAYDVTVTGMANHAGTTPMNDRKDALLAASQLVQAVREVVVAESGRQVGTVGKLEVSPNARNVVPGKVKMTIELRDLSSEKLERLNATIEARAQKIAVETGTEIVLSRTQQLPASLADIRLQTIVEHSATELGLAAMRLPSGAGHDAMNLAKVAPMAMVFVPSKAGISHSPKEYSSWIDCARGADVLLNSIIAADRSPI